MTAAELLAEVKARAASKRWRIAELGLEDDTLLLVREQRMVAVVLTEKPATQERQGWLDALRMAGVETWVWGTADLDGDVARVLR